MNKVIGGLVGAFLLIGFMTFSVYNSLVSQTTAIDGQWAQVETQYQRRFDLVPNLVAATQGFMKQEKTVFEAIAEARTRYVGAKTIDEKVEGAASLESALGRLLVIMENYPELKSNETVARLMDELAGTENRISVERKRFNELVQSYNATIKRVPTNLIAGIFGFKSRAYFRAVEGAEQAPKVEL